MAVSSRILGLVGFIEGATAGLVVQHGCYLIVWSRAKLTRDISFNIFTTQAKRILGYQEFGNGPKTDQGLCKSDQAPPCEDGVISG